VEKSQNHSTNHNANEADGLEFASLLQNMFEVVTQDDSSPSVQQGKERNLRQRKPVEKPDTPKTVGRRKRHVQEKKNAVSFQSENVTTDNGKDISSVKAVSNAGEKNNTECLTVENCVKEQCRAPETRSFTSFKEVTGPRQLSPQEVEEGMSRSVPIFVDGSVVSDCNSPPRVSSSHDSVESRNAVVLGTVTATPGVAGLCGIPASGCGESPVVLGNGADDTDYDDDCDALLDLELDIYNEPNDDTEIEKEFIKNEKTVEPTTKVKSKIHNIVHKCQECGEMFTHGRPFKRHLLSHAVSQYPLSCRRCKVVFEAFILFKHHKCQHTTRELACNQCQTKCPNDKRLLRHMHLKHGKVESEPQHFCKFCNKGFRRKLTLYKHYKEHASGKFVCLRCGEFIQDKETYYEHITKHDRDAEYMCEKCGIGFSKMQLYKKHMKAHERFECPECNMTFPSRKAQFRHNRLIHAAQFGDLSSKRYRCDICPKSFPRPGLLDLHKRIHTGKLLGFWEYTHVGIL
jgi:hypothetical protein